jgi:hypothetical protein
VWRKVWKPAHGTPAAFAAGLRTFLRAHVLSILSLRALVRISSPGLPCRVHSSRASSIESGASRLPLSDIGGEVEAQASPWATLGCLCDPP